MMTKIHILTQLLQLIISALQRENSSDFTPTIDFLIQAKDNLDSFAKTKSPQPQTSSADEIETIEKVANNFNDPDKNSFLKDIREKINHHNKIKKDNEEFQKSLVSAEEQLQQEEIIKSLSQSSQSS